MLEVLTDLSGSTLARAIKANLYAFFESFRQSSAAVIQDNPYGFRWHTPVDQPGFNGVISTKPPTEDVAQVVRDTLTYFQSRNIVNFTWWLVPHLDPAIWSRHLLPHGFQYDDHMPGMAIDLLTLPPSIQRALTIRQVDDPHMLAEWVRTYIQAAGIPKSVTADFLTVISSLGITLPFRYYLGYLHGEPVATATLFIQAGVAGIYNVATVEEARGQGFGSAMTLAPLYEARDLGYRAGILHSSGMGYSIYQKLGFQTHCQIGYYYWQAQSSQEGG